MMARIACVLAAALVALPARGEPALWRVDSPTARVYLFGTMHILPKQAAWFAPKIAAAFNASGTLWEEADVGQADANAASGILGRALDDNYDLWSHLPAGYADKFRGQLTDCHLPPEIVTHTRPWMAAMMASICQMMKEEGGNLGPMRAAPEAMLADKAHESGKPMQFFETAQQQIDYLANAPETAQLSQLRQAIDEAAGGKDDFAHTEAAWLEGDVAAIAASVAHTRDSDPAFYATVFPERNARFAARIEQMLRERGTVFVAIGAGHLAGGDSVIAMLAKKGIVAARQ